MSSTGRKATLLGVDLGERKTGLAWVGRGGIIEPLDVIPTAELERHLRRHIAELEVDKLIYGLPLRAGKMGGAARLVRRKARAMASLLEIPLEFADESGTTDEARQRRGEGGLDARCAALILERHLCDESSLEPASS